MGTRYAILLAGLLSGCAGTGTPVPPVAWEGWSQEAFARAAREKRLVLLDLGAVWCHWCHVMDRETWGDPEVARLIAKDFVAVHVNQDERPDLANRYEDYGWPATVVFAADGTELVKFRGYIPPRRMAALLRAVAADPTPGPSAVERILRAPAAEPKLPAEIDDGLHAAWEAAYDRAQQGWGDAYKYLDPDCVELAIAEGRDDLARGTLDAMLALVDPVWGGVYQYSDGGVWTNPHFEKIMSFQAEDLRIYSLAYRVYGDERYLRAARGIERYLLAFLRSPEGAFYASQDADLVPGDHAAGYFSLDDAGRRALGMPRIDRSLYARENGLAALGLASLARATGDTRTLEAAVAAAEWAVAHRGRTDGGFRHGEDDAAGPYLADTLAMARAFLELHQATQDPGWLERAGTALRFVDATFRTPAGFATAAAASEGSRAPRPQMDENIGVARLALRLHYLANSPSARDAADHALKYLAGAAPGVNGVRAGGILLAARESAGEPVSVVVVGKRGDPETAALLQAALSAPAPCSTVRLLAPGESSEFAQDRGEPTAFVCSGGSCSSPLHDPAEVLRACAISRKR
ncbi:MAG: thioredoxin domain-containing protein [Planctomycetes bacterium]|nr:thioredoxin domain-containing protein [Planctomycetota bacterium]